MKVVVGIGNPGRRYHGTRHNVGFDILELLARAAGATEARERFHSFVAEGAFGGDKVVLVQPQTYVNESGRAVRELIDWYQLPLDELMVVCDDLNLPLASLRLRRQGSSGGHHGLESISQWLATDEYPRLRVGIGASLTEEECARAQVDTVDFVLSRFLPEEREQIDAACRRAVEAIDLWIHEGIDAAMNRYN
jgi:PTH1 family peptidyl-tRNA hydrolase